MIITYHALPRSYYEGLVIGLEVCQMTPPLRDPVIW